MNYSPASNIAVFSPQPHKDSPNKNLTKALPPSSGVPISLNLKHAKNHTKGQSDQPDSSRNTLPKQDS